MQQAVSLFLLAIHVAIKSDIGVDLKQAAGAALLKGIYNRLCNKWNLLMSHLVQLLLLQFVRLACGTHLHSFFQCVDVQCVVVQRVGLCGVLHDVSQQSECIKSQHCRFRSVIGTIFFLPVFLLMSACATESVKGELAETPGRLIENSMLNSQSLVNEIADWQSLSSEIKKIKKIKEKNDSLLQIEPVMAKADAPAAKGITVQLVAAPIEQVLYTLAHDANLQLQLNQPLSGTVTLVSDNQPIESLLKQIALQVPVGGQIENGRLQLWGDEPYTQSYAVDYLNIDRSTRSQVGLATQVGTINAGPGTNGGVSNSSQTSLLNTADHHFWASLATDLDGLVNAADLLHMSNYTINRDAGMVTLNGAAPLHTRLQNYLDKLNEHAQRQVLIEATVVEVALSNEFQAGIDWQLLSNKVTGVSAAQILSGSAQVNADTVNRIVAPSGLLSLVQESELGTLSGTLNLLEQFGDVRILSKPRIIALNNQTSVLKVVDNRVYFTVNVERQRSENKDEIITETQIHTVPVGLVMNVTPYIDEADEVMLNVRPTLSRILGFVDDPNPELASAAVRNSVPEIQVREMESMLRVKSGEMAIIGGLMQDIKDGSDRSLPGMASLPVVGALFRQRRKTRQQSELLIVLKPTVLHPANSESQVLN